MQYDVAVVGLGAMGSATLYQCARRGMKAIGIDRHSPPHTLGSSHGDTRITRLAVGEGPAYVPFVKASHRIWRELEHETGETLLTECGALVIAGSEGGNSHHGKADFVRETCRAAESYGIAHEILASDALRSRFPYLIGLKGDEIAYFEPEGGFVRPEACIRAQLTMARRHGAEIRTETPALSVVCRPTGGVLIDTSAGAVIADKVIIAAGAWTAGLIGEVFPDILTVTRQVLHWFKVENRPSVPKNSPVMIWMHGESDTDYFYAFPPQFGEGAMKFATEQYAQTTSVDTIRRTVDPEESKEMFERHVRGRVAGIIGHAVRSAACLYTTTPDRGFVLDCLPANPDVFVISACSGHGFKHSAGIGAAVADRLEGSQEEFDLAPFGFGRFQNPASTPSSGDLIP